MITFISREPSQDSNNGSSNSDLEPSRVLAEFVGGLGPGQVAGRQALGAGSLGELHLTIQVTFPFYILIQMLFNRSDRMPLL